MAGAWSRQMRARYEAGRSSDPARGRQAAPSPHIERKNRAG